MNTNQSGYTNDADATFDRVQGIREEENKVRREFLSKVKISKESVSIFLMNGCRLVGKIEKFDGSVLLLKAGETTQMVQLNAIATVMPQL